MLGHRYHVGMQYEYGNEHLEDGPLVLINRRKREAIEDLHRIPWIDCDSIDWEEEDYPDDDE